MSVGFFIFSICSICCYIDVPITVIQFGCSDYWREVGVGHTPFGPGLLLDMGSVGAVGGAAAGSPNGQPSAAPLRPGTIAVTTIMYYMFQLS